MTNLSATDVRSIPEKSAAGGRIGFLLALLLYIVLQLFTQPSSYGDTPVYASDILAHSREQFGPGKDPLWELGHIFWRPVAYLAWAAALPLVQHRFSDAPVLGAYAALVALNLVAGLVCTIFMYKLAFNLSRRQSIALLCTAGLLGTNAVLNFMQSGTSYIPGLAFQLIGLHLLERSISQGRFTAGLAWMIAGAWALSVCLWFPYVLSLPGMLLFGLLWGEEKRTSFRIRYLLHLCVAIGVLVGAAYVFVLQRNKISNPQEAMAWFRNASHGMAQTRGYLRIVTGLPRTFFYLGDDGLVLKRYVTRDPYAPVGLVDLVKLSLWKIAAVYASLAIFLYSLWRSAISGKKMLAAVIAAALPVLVFAIFLFEPGESVRYLPFYAMLFAGLAFAVATASKVTRVILAGFIVAVVLTNTAALSVRAADETFAPAIARIEVLQAAMQPQDEALLHFVSRRHFAIPGQLPFHPVNRRRPVMFHYAIEPGTKQAMVWHRDVAKRILTTWEKQGQFWISKRLISETPAPSWRSGGSGRSEFEVEAAKLLLQPVR